MNTEYKTPIKAVQTAGKPETKIPVIKKTQVWKPNNLLGSLLHYPQGKSPLERGISHWR
jgi:hypothetical protein